MAKYLEQKDALHAGRKPRAETEGTTVKEAVNAFLIAKDIVESGELSPRTWTDYKDACDEIIAAFGKSRLVANLDAADFAALRKQHEQRLPGNHRGSALACGRRSCSQVVVPLHGVLADRTHKGAKSRRTT